MEIKFEVKMPKKGTIEEIAWNAVKTEIEKNVKAAVRNMTCEVHHQQAVVTVKGNIDDFRIEVSGCCSDFVEKAEKAISAKFN